MCTIYFVFVDTISQHTMIQHLQLLPEKLKNKLNNINDETSRTKSLVGLMIVGKLLNDQRTGIDIHCLSYDRNGKPLLTNGHNISIAHSGNMVLCCYSAQGAVGLDVEALGYHIGPLYDEYLTPKELTALNTDRNPEVAFGKMWVRKEAVLKADGIGLLHPLNELDVTDDTVELRNNTYYLQDINITPDFVAALATTHPHNEARPKEVTF